MSGKYGHFSDIFYPLSLFFCLCYTAYGILAPWEEEPVPLVMEAESYPLDHQWSLDIFKQKIKSHKNTRKDNLKEQNGYRVSHRLLVSLILWLHFGRILRACFSQHNKKEKMSKAVSTSFRPRQETLMRDMRLENEKDSQVTDVPREK